MTAKVRIQNDGQAAYFTKITNAETGEDIPMVQRVKLVYDARDRASHPPRAILTVAYPLVDIIVDAEIKHVCPYCGHPVDEEGKPI
jgi:hypothetical protein